LALRQIEPACSIAYLYNGAEQGTSTEALSSCRPIDHRRSSSIFFSAFQILIVASGVACLASTLGLHGLFGGLGIEQADNMWLVAKTLAVILTIKLISVRMM
jgi:hypothetical protein